jgi:basic amino acid/polyamine antiporter, APA family
MEKPNLVRAISRWDLMAITINTIIGAGIFGLPSKVAALIGNYSIFAFAVCALIIAFIVICFAEVSSRFKDTGGMYLYAKEAFGSVVGFEVGWLYWVVRVTTFAANCNLFITYLSYFYPNAKDDSTRTFIVIIIVAVITLVNSLGVKQSTILTNIFTVGKIVPLIIFAAVGLFFIQPANFTFQAIPETVPFSKAILLLIYAFVGFEAAAIPAGETKNPQKSVPFALLSALAIVAVLFILIQIVCIGTLPEIAKSERPLADAASNFLGVFGAAFITIGALISIIGNLNVGFLTGSRMPFAMAEQNELPSFFAATHKRFKTPYINFRYGNRNFIFYFEDKFCRSINNFYDYTFACLRNNLCLIARFSLP